MESAEKHNHDISFICIQCDWLYKKPLQQYNQYNDDDDDEDKTVNNKNNVIVITVSVGYELANRHCVLSGVSLHTILHLQKHCAMKASVKIWIIPTALGLETCEYLTCEQPD